MRKILVLLFIFTGLICDAQNVIVFKVRYKPETNYDQTIEQTSETTVKYAGTADFLRNLRTQGVDNPTINTVSFKTKSALKTGKLTNGSSFPLSVRFIETVNNGGKVAIPNGTVIYGTGSSDGVPTLDSISGKLADDIKRTLLNTMQSAFSQMTFPVRKVKIGESFSKQSPLTLPIADITLNILTTTNYKLVKITDKLAMFEISQVYTLKSEIRGNNVKLTGTGKGNMIYDIDNNFYKRYQIDTSLTTNMKLDNFSVDLGSKSRFVQSFTITKN